jgi:hypothetical protein
MVDELFAIVTGLLVFACALRWLTWRRLEDEVDSFRDLDSSECGDHSDRMDHPDQDR